MSTKSHPPRFTDIPDDSIDHSFNRPLIQAATHCDPSHRSILDAQYSSISTRASVLEHQYSSSMPKYGVMPGDRTCVGPNGPSAGSRRLR